MLARSVAETVDFESDRANAVPLSCQLATGARGARRLEAKDQLELCMKRNMDLVREILLQVEATGAGKTIKLNIADYGEEEIGLHVELMIGHGLIEGTTVPSGDGPAHRILSYRIGSMTWEGHDFLDAARNDSIWEKAKKKCLAATGGLAFDVLKACLVEFGKEAVSHP